MRVLLDVTFAVRAPYSGTAIYLDRVQEALSRLDGIEIVPACNKRRGAPAGGGAGSLRNLLVDHWWTAMELPRLARRHGADVIHHPLPAPTRSQRTPQVVTVHDLAFERRPECFDRAFRIYAHRCHRAAALAAGAVICVSETTAADVEILWDVPRERIVVARHGPGQMRGSPGRAAPEHFLYVGDDEPRKNVTTLLAAYQVYRARAQSPLALVLAGAVDRCGPGVKGGADRCGPGVRTEHRPGAERLAQLYAGAAALVQPSLYEGFGLTALEAMSTGTPVIAASSPGLVEVCGDAARYADPREATAFAAAMGDLAGSSALRDELGARGLARAQRFSWEACARAHVDAYSLAFTR